MKNLFKKFKNLFKKRSKKNELEIFEKFRIVPKKEERERIEATVRHIKRRKCYADNKKEKRKNMASSPLLNFSRKIIPNYS